MPLLIRRWGDPLKFVPFAKRGWDASASGPRSLLTELLVLGGIVLAMAMLGPFGSYTTSASERLAHWAFLLLAGYAFFRPVIAAGSALADQTGLPRPAAIAVACLFGALPTSLIAALASAGFRWRQVTVGELAMVYLQVLIVGAIVTIIQMLALRSKQAGEAEGTQPPGTPDEGAVDPGEEEKGRGAATGGAMASPPAFLDLLPGHLGNEVICLENEDHYVRVYTRIGNAIVLMRMRDAVVQLQGRGERVHRSWWVARDAVVAVVRQDRNVRLKLLDGREVPVARASVPALRAKGWLQGPPIET